MVARLVECKVAGLAAAAVMAILLACRKYVHPNFASVNGYDVALKLARLQIKVRR